jgi:hypothetical protein
VPGDRIASLDNDLPSAATHLVWCALSAGAAGKLNKSPLQADESRVRLTFKRQLLIVGGSLIVVVGTVVLLAGCSMRTLSAVRGFVGGESLWSKGQKDSIVALTRYTHSLDESDYDGFLAAIRIYKRRSENRPVNAA